MRTKQKTVKAALLSVMFMLVSLSAFGRTIVTINGINYTIKEWLGTAMVTTNANYSGNLVIPATITYQNEIYSVTEIDGQAFKDCSGLKSVTIAPGMVSIGDNAFEGCTSLESIIIPQTVTYIAGGTFSGCKNLKSVQLSDNMHYIMYGTFSGCEKLENINFPKNLQVIQADAFFRCRGLSTIEIPESVVEIENMAFSGCYPKSLKIPSSLKIFDGIPSSLHLEYLEIDNEEILVKKKYKVFNDLKELVIGNSVNCIPDNAFNGASELTTITFPENLDSIGKNAFKGCNITGPLNIPSKVSYIGSNAFEDCEAVTSITLPKNLRVIGNSTFKGCKLITSLILPSSLSEIGDSAFYNCSKLQSITIPNSVRHIGEFAFIDCVNAKTITLPSSADLSIGKRAFFNNFYTTAIYSPSPVPPAIDFVTFYPEDKSLCTVYVPVGSATAYKGADGWKDYNIVEKNSETCEAPKITLEGGKIRFSSNTLNARYRYSVRMKEIESETSGNEGIEAKIVISAYTIAGSNTDSPVVTREFSLDELIGIEGDVNGDNEVNVSDVTKLVNLILKK